MITTTKAGTEILPVQVEPGPGGTTHVWLRRGIVETEDGWEAEELHFLHPDSLTAKDAADSFDALWAAHAPASDLQAQIDELTDLLLGGEPGGSATTDRLAVRGVESAEVLTVQRPLVIEK